MGYFKRVAIDIEEAIALEVKKGFECRDEMNEVFHEIAQEYNVTVGEVWELYYNMDVDLTETT